MKRMSYARRLVSLAAAMVAALTVGVPSVAADPAGQLTFSVACPGMAPFTVNVAGAVGFVQGQRLLTIRQATPTQGSLELVECTATNPQVGSLTVFLQFVERG
jgi:hypothetical protein